MKKIRPWMVGLLLLLALPLLLSFFWLHVPRTVRFDAGLPYTEINGYKFHTEIFGRPEATPLYDGNSRYAKSSAPSWLGSCSARPLPCLSYAAVQPNSRSGFSTAEVRDCRLPAALAAAPRRSG